MLPTFHRYLIMRAVLRSSYWLAGVSQELPFRRALRWALPRLDRCQLGSRTIGGILEEGVELHRILLGMLCMAGDVLLYLSFDGPEFGLSSILIVLRLAQLSPHLGIGKFNIVPIGTPCRVHRQ